MTPSASEAWADRGWRQVLANASFRRLWLAEAFSVVGTQISRVALVLYLFRERDSVAVLAGLVLLEALPGVLAAPFAGVLVDRVSKRAVLAGSALARMVLAVTILTWPTLPVIFVAAALHSVAAAFFQPAKAASVPLVVESGQLPRANGVEQISSNLLLIVGPILGAELLLWTGLTATLVVDAACFLVAALLTAGLSLPRRRDRRGTKERSARESSPVRSLVAGWSYVGGDRLVRQVAFLFFVSLLCAGLWLPLAPFFIREVLGSSEHLLSWQIGATGAGAALGAFVVPAWMRRLGAGPTLLFALLSEGLVMVVYALLGSPWISTALMFVWGISVSAIVVPFYSLLQTLVEGQFLGRVFSVVTQSEGLAVALATAVAVLLRGAVAVETIFLAAGLAYVAVTGASFFTSGGRLLRATR